MDRPSSVVYGDNLHIHTYLYIYIYIYRERERERERERGLKPLVTKGQCIITFIPIKFIVIGCLSLSVKVR